MKKIYRLTTFDQVKIGRRFRYNKKWLLRDSGFICIDESCVGQGMKKAIPLKMDTVVVTELGDTYD